MLFLRLSVFRQMDPSLLSYGFVQSDFALEQSVNRLARELSPRHDLNMGIHSSRAILSVLPDEGCLFSEAIAVKLVNPDRWEEFSRNETEMIVNAEGR